MDKAPDAFRTISEVADHLETPAHVLRFWETRFPQVKPVKGAGGRRYYRPSDVALLSGIRRLLHTDGMTIRGVQKVLRDQGVRHVAELGGEAYEDETSLSDLMPAPRPPGEVVALRPGSEPAPEPVTQPVVMSVDAPDSTAADPEPAPPDAPSAPEPAAAFSGLGGFGLDLDVPRAGEGGFIAFSPAAPAPPRPAPAKPAALQPSLFDLPEAEPASLFDGPEFDGPELDAPEVDAPEFVAPEFDVPEAPHIHVEDEDDAPAGLIAFGLPDPEPQPGSLPETMPESVPESVPEPLTESLEAVPVAEPEEAPETLLSQADPPELAAAPPAETQTALPDSPQEEVAAEGLALAGLAPRLRRLNGVAPDRLFALADLQARLGLVHAQMAEAHSRPRRNPGA